MKKVATVFPTYYSPWRVTNATSHLHAASSMNAIDAAMLAAFGVFGLFQFLFAQRGSAFYSGDTSYLELGLSLVNGHQYGFNFRPEAMLPPGFPVLIALAYPFVGTSHEALVRIVGILGLLGYIVSYLLLRRFVGRSVAAVICLLLISSPTLFLFSTRVVFSDLPYFFASMAALVLALRIDAAKEDLSVRGLAWLCGIAVVVSGLLRSAGLMLSVGLFVWLGLSLIFNRAHGIQRFKRFRGVLIAGLISQALWMGWAHRHTPPVEWPIGGYPQPYLAQIAIKSGNHPELGRATLVDIARRVEDNAADRTANLVYFLTRKSLTDDWCMPWVTIPLVLIAIGLFVSIWSGGGLLHDWYFVGHETMYLLWPWNFETRFLLPVAPLACMYMWRGCSTVAGWAKKAPGRVSAFTVALGMSSVVFALVWGADASSQYLTAIPGLPIQLSIIGIGCWLCLIGAAVWIWSSAQNSPRATPTASWLTSISRFAATTSMAAIALAALVIGVGIAREVQLGRENVHFSEAVATNYPNITAAEWLRVRSPADATVMARQMDVVYHYARRRVVWFPPISDPEVLMRGIIDHHVQFIVVERRGSDDETYWIPTAKMCFAQLTARYPEEFALIQEGPGEAIYSIVRPGMD